MRRACKLALAALLGAVATPALAQTAAGAIPRGDLQFDGARLGMSLSQWKALPPPQGSTADVATECSNDTTLDTASRVTFSVSGSEPPVVVCSYVARLGRYVLAQDFPLAKTYFARNPKFTFVSGRLAKIEFKSSINAFDDLVAAFEARFGAASQTIRDQIRTPFGLTLPRVQKIWRLPDGLVSITDPSDDLDRLVVDFTGSGEARGARPG